eukprot:TRINITY_DN20952_c0_g1_i1.p1 TRINITY_DN20952_c0_g1~~TRINITY_DN20952_c0_g1_i1.p1  ORF type:complete len:1083 (-),score=232.72 TRINITY_DN20952_c0_g1_i1:49-3297(-)
MFDRSSHGVQSLELLSPQGNNGALWKVSAGVQKVYDKALKGFVYQLVANGSQAIMQLPKDDRRASPGLGLVQQPFLVFQVFLPQNRERPFSLEIAVTDVSRTRRRLFLSALSQEAQTNALLARLPLSGLRRGAWLNLCLDVDSLVRDSFGQVLKSIDSLAVHAECRLRKVFTLRSPPSGADEEERLGGEASCTAALQGLALAAAADADSGGAQGLADDRRAFASEPIPRLYDFPAGVEQRTHIVGAEQVRADVCQDASFSEDRLAAVPTPECLSPAPPQGEFPPAQQLLQQLAADEEALGTFTLEESAYPEEAGAATNQPQGSALAAAKGRMAMPLLPLGQVGTHCGLPEEVGYQDMVKRVTVPEEEEAEPPRPSSVHPERAEAQASLPEAASSLRRKLPHGVVPKNRQSSEGPQSHRASAPAAASGAAGVATKAASAVPGPLAAGLGPTSARRPKSKSQRRPESLTALQARDTRRMPATARAARERSPSNGTRPAKMRPLPLEKLEMGPSSRNSREDQHGASQPSSSSSTSASVSSRRGRRPGRPPAKAEEESISPSPTAATKRRRDLAMKTLHKTAEIYGAPVGGPHRHPPSLRAERSEAPEPLEQRPLFDRTLELPAERPSTEEGQKGDEEPPPSPTTEGVDPARPMLLPVSSRASAVPEPHPSLSARKGRPPALESGAALPPVQQDAEISQRTPSTLASPSQVLAAQAEAEDEIVFFSRTSSSPSPGPAGAIGVADKLRKPNFEWPKVGAAAAAAGTNSAANCDAWSAFGATVRHTDGAPFSNPFRQGGGQVRSQVRPGGTTPGGFELSLAPRNTPKADAKLAEVPAAADTVDKLPVEGVDDEQVRSCSEDTTKEEAQQLHEETVPGQDAGGSDSEEVGSSPGTWNRGDASVDSQEEEVPDEEAWLEERIGGEAPSPEPTAAEIARVYKERQEQRRIKSLSPPRRWRRPQPFLNLDKVINVAQPSSAPSEPGRRHERPFGQLRGNIRQEPASAAEDAQLRPFTPPVVPIGRLLRRAAAGGGQVPEQEPQEPSREVQAAVQAGGDESMLEAIYDPLLDIYYDPSSNQYFERRHSGDGSD